MLRKLFVSLLSVLLLQHTNAQESFLYPQELFPFKGQNNKYGFTDVKGKLLVLPKYDKAEEPSEGLSLVKLNNKYGYVDATGKEVIPTQYEEAGPFSEQLAAVKKNGKYGYINTSGREVISFSYEYAQRFSEGFAAVRQNGKYGYIDRNGKKLTGFEFNDAQAFSEGIAKVFKGETIYDKQGFIDRKGKLVIPYIYDHNLNTYSTWNEVRDFQDGLLLVSKGGMLGYINNKGTEVIPAKYSRLSPLHKGHAAYYSSTESKWGIVNKTGKEVTDLLYDNVDFSLLDMGYNLVITGRKNTTAANAEQKYGFYNIASGHIITLGSYDDIGDITEGMMTVIVNNKYGVVDSNGKEVIAPKYDYIGEFVNGTAVVQLGKKYGIINKSGKELIPVKYNGVENFTDGMAVVEMNGKVGYADVNGREVVPPQYMDAFPFSDGIGTVKNLKVGLVDKTGRPITPIKYDEALPFKNGVAVVVVNKQYGVVNNTGKEIVAPVYPSIVPVTGYLFFQKDSKWGVMNNSGEVIIPARFEGFVQGFIDDTAVAVQNGRAVYIDKTGKLTGEPYQ